MKETIVNSVYFGVALTLGVYLLAMEIRKKVKSNLCNPLIIAIILIIVILQIFKIDYVSYYQGGQYIHFFLTPVTICLGIPLYKQIKLLKDHLAAVLISIFAGVLTSGLSIFTFSMIFKLDHITYVSMLPKSITTAIAIGLAEELGGISAFTVAAIMVTGILGSIIAETICKIFRIVEPMAVGLAIGTASHAMGTSRALEIGEVEGAMSSLAIAVCGLITVVVVPMMTGLI